MHIIKFFEGRDGSRIINPDKYHFPSLTWDALPINEKLFIIYFKAVATWSELPHFVPNKTKIFIEVCAKHNVEASRSPSTRFRPDLAP
jgi:hypothetical protein